MARISRRSAFTLVEILIVVVILAILAAAVIPQFTDSTTDAKNSTTVTNLQTLRGQFALYRAQHTSLPTLANVPTQLTTKTTASGGASGTLGPYLQMIPVNPSNDSSALVAGTGAAVVVGGAGWQYDAATGNIYANDATNLTK